ncbi:TPA: DEAD/DEAH box helicase [Streptococcus pneumoniae]
MAKLIPGKIRIEGVALYETGKVDIIKEKNNRLYARVAEEELRYSLEDDLIFCACDFFQKRGYCVHLAALEHFLKNDERGQEILWSLEEGHEEKEAVETKVTLGGKFLDRILSPKSECAYELSAVGQVEAGTNHILWTLRIGQINSQKYYVIRDIPLFLRIVEQRKSYMIGKIYEESLSWEAFDDASQELLTFLHGLTEEGLVPDLFFQNQGRHLFFPLTFFEQGVNLLMALPHFQFDHQVDSYQTLLFQDMHADANLFAFTVTEYSDYFEMEISESPRVNVFYQGAVLFHKGQVYFLTDQQMRLLKEIKALPVDRQGKKYLQFDSSDRDKLASCLTLFIQMGTVSAPERLQIKTFAPSFYFDREEDNRIRLEIQFDYGNRQVSSRQELEELPFSSDADLEERIFQVCLAAGFEADFQSWRQALKAESVYHFFHDIIPVFEKLGHVDLSDKLEELYSLASPQVQIASKGGLLEIQFDFQDIAQEEIDQAIQALVANQDFYIDSSNQVYFFDEETKKIRQNLQELGQFELKDGTLQARKSLAYSLAHLFEGRDRVSFSQEFQNLAQDLTHPEDFPLQATQVKADLRDYQEKGIGWLQMLHHYGFGGILADDMGLGKTLQTIAFLTSQVTKESRVLILAPSGLIYNWADEFQKFAPQLDVAVVHGLKASRVEILSGLMRLRQICDTPALFMEDYQGASGKLDSLRDLLVQVADGGHRVLIFSQFKGMLEKIEQELPDLGLTSFKITGSTPAKERQDMTKAFNQGERDAFLISLKAGGVGLNLTGADTVILVDLWWNPAVEAQAIGRAHRMGQEETVEVYRLVTKGTIEEKIQELQEQKKHLVSQVLDGTESRGSLTLAEIREILGISEAST